MTDEMPEEIWVEDLLEECNTSTAYKCQAYDDCIKYTLSDIAEARIKELKDALREIMKLNSLTVEPPKRAKVRAIAKQALGKDE